MLLLFGILYGLTLIASDHRYKGRSSNLSDNLTQSLDLSKDPLLYQFDRLYLKKERKKEIKKNNNNNN